MTLQPVQKSVYIRRVFLMNLIKLEEHNLLWALTGNTNLLLEKILFPTKCIKASNRAEAAWISQNKRSCFVKRILDHMCLWPPDTCFYNLPEVFWPIRYTLSNFRDPITIYLYHFKTFLMGKYLLIWETLKITY